MPESQLFRLPFVAGLGVFRMLLAGDIVPGSKPSRLDLDGGLLLCNLESPLLCGNDGCAPAPKVGPTLFSTSLPQTRSEMVFALANNHLMDFGASGLRSTMNLLAENNCRGIGAGMSVSEARSPAILEEDGVRIGVISCCEAQFGVALANRAGVAEIGPWIYSSVRQLRHVVDILIVSVHAALELSPWPSPRLQQLYRSLIDAGAHVIHGHHAHVPQGWEEYNEGLILYGLGNCLVDPDRWRSIPNTLWSLASEISWVQNHLCFRVMTLTVEEKDGFIVASRDSENGRKEKENYLNLCNIPLADPLRLSAVYQEVSLRLFFRYYAEYLGFQLEPNSGMDWSGWARQIKKNIKSYVYRLAGKCRHTDPAQSEFRLWYHLFACMSHREAIAEALGMLAGELPDLRTGETRALADCLMPWSVGVIPQ